MRQRSRAFIVADAAKPADRVVFINAGAWSVFMFWPSTGRLKYQNILSALYTGVICLGALMSSGLDPGRNSDNDRILYLLLCLMIDRYRNG